MIDLVNLPLLQFCWLERILRHKQFSSHQSEFGDFLASSLASKTTGRLWFPVVFIIQILFKRFHAFSIVYH